MLFGKGSFGTITFNGQSLKEKKNSSISLEIKKKNEFYCFAYLNNASKTPFLYGNECFEFFLLL